MALVLAVFATDADYDCLLADIAYVRADKGACCEAVCVCVCVCVCVKYLCIPELTHLLVNLPQQKRYKTCVPTKTAISTTYSPLKQTARLCIKYLQKVIV